MKTDPAIAAIRAARTKISDEFGNDPARLIAHYLEYQKKFGERLLNASTGEPGPTAARAAEQRHEQDGHSLRPVCK